MEIKIQVLFEMHDCNFNKIIAKHYTTVDRLMNGLDDFKYKDFTILAKRQYTGLKDKNGLDILNGDILKILFTDWPSQSQPEKLSLEEYKDSLTKIFTVVFHKGAFQISCPSYYGGDELDYGDISCGKHGYIKVIGNNIENPELSS